MQVIDCRNYRELLDSYLSEELSVETNHAMLRHTEMCQGCRGEMAARRRLRAVLKRACSTDRLGAEAEQRLRDCLRRETAGGVAAIGWGRRLRRLFEVRGLFHLAAAVAVAAAITAGIGAWLYGAFDGPIARPDLALSPALFEQAAGDHEHCGLKFAVLSGPFEMPDSAVSYDPSYAGLEKVVAPAAAGLELRTVHLCGHKGRRFAHLVYAGEGSLISLLVTERDGKALDLDLIPTDDGIAAGMQTARRENLSIGAFQTTRHVVAVVSDLEAEKNRLMAERLATPVTEHLRRFEQQTAMLSRISFIGRR